MIPTVLKERLVFGNSAQFFALKAMEDTEANCEECDGDGMVPCPDCDGTGKNNREAE